MCFPYLILLNKCCSANMHMNFHCLYFFPTLKSRKSSGQLLCTASVLSGIIYIQVLIHKQSVLILPCLQLFHLCDKLYTAMYFPTSTLLWSSLLPPTDQQYSSILCTDFSELKKQVISLLFQILHTNLTKVIQLFLSMFNNFFFFFLFFFLTTYFSCMYPKK